MVNNVFNIYSYEGYVNKVILEFNVILVIVVNSMKGNDSKCI